jgi:hypothetical protein
MVTLITGSPVGNIVNSQTQLVDSPPVFYFQEKINADGTTVGHLNNPDADGFYYNLSGTTARPVYEGGCYENFQLSDIRDVNMVRCDAEGDRSAIQRRNSLQVTFTLKEFFKLDKLRHMLNFGDVTTTASHSEKAGVGQIDNTKFYYLWFPSVYDENTGDYFSWHIHRAQFTNAWAMSYTYANPATVTIQVTGFSEPSLPAAQRFATVFRLDPSAL